MPCNTSFAELFTICIPSLMYWFHFAILVGLPTPYMCILDGKEKTANNY